jgi:hypothetical protein
VQQALFEALVPLGLGSVKEAHTGSVLFIQRVDSAIRLNVHGHLLSLDGVYARAGDGTLCFHELPEPSAEDVAEVARHTARRLVKVLKEHSREESFALPRGTARSSDVSSVTIPASAALA